MAKLQPAEDDVSTCETCRFRTLSSYGQAYCSEIQRANANRDDALAEIDVDGREAPTEPIEVKLIVLPTFGCVLWEEP